MNSRIIPREKLPLVYSLFPMLVKYSDVKKFSFLNIHH